jgi:hypothetical protein
VRFFAVSLALLAMAAPAGASACVLIGIDGYDPTATSPRKALLPSFMRAQAVQGRVDACPTDPAAMRFTANGPGHYMLQVVRLSGVAAIEAVSSPIWLEP